MRGEEYTAYLVAADVFVDHGSSGAPAMSYDEEKERYEMLGIVVSMYSSKGWALITPLSRYGQAVDTFLLRRTQTEMLTKELRRP